MAGHGRRRGGAHEEEHENHERWLISYADMITLLMVLFVVMFAISNVDQNKFEALSDGLASGFGAPRYVAIQGASSPLQGAGVNIDPVRVDVVAMAMADDDTRALAETLATGKDRAEAASDLLAAREELARLDAVAEAARQALSAAGLADRAQFRITSDGLVVALVADDVFFASASAELQPVGNAVVDALAPVLAGIGNPVDAEGHANHLPLTAGAVYPTNWELSAARAAGVVRRFVDVEGIDGARMSATGYGSTRPLVPTDQADAIERNRRVDLVILSTETTEVRALLPKLVAERG